MRSLKYLLGLLALVWCLTPARAMAQTPTATATATATATPTPVAIPSPVPILSKVTHFGYLSADAANGGLIGGYVVHLKATAALIVGQVVVPDTANDRQVIVAPAAATNPIGIVVGAGTPGAAGQTSGMGVNPGTGQMAIVQVSGVAQAVCDNTISRGTKVQASAAIAGGVTSYSAGTVDEQIGVLLSSCTNLNPGYVLLYK